MSEWVGGSVDNVDLMFDNILRIGYMIVYAYA